MKKFFLLFFILGLFFFLPEAAASFCECDWKGRCDWCDLDCVVCRPSPTPTQPVPTPTEPEPTFPPEVTPSPTPTPTSSPPEEGPPPVGGPGEPWVCGASVPPTPSLLGVNRTTTDQVNLSWTEVDPVTHYSVSYGLSSGNYIYGVNNTGKVTSFTIGGLDPGADYCFVVRAVNDCAPSELSNEICPGETRGQVLGVTTLADTGSASDQLFQVLFIIGCGCLGLGLKLFIPKKLDLS